ncbi:MAG: FAD-dependent oxidoreductase, partial [Dechloromonas sp.]|nr:FAD-dependent oxidoreductase [Dechloromonas sp.]
MKVAVIGGGINGVMTAWAFARRGDCVDLFEKGRLMSATSRSSTKMLHGGLRYLEHGHLGLVREALQERSWWIRQAPQLVNPLELLIPIYRNGERAKWLVGAGIRLYDLLAT